LLPNLARKISETPAFVSAPPPKSIVELKNHPVIYTLPELSTKIEVLPQILSYEENVGVS